MLINSKISEIMNKIELFEKDINKTVQDLNESNSVAEFKSKNEDTGLFKLLNLKQIEEAEKVALKKAAFNKDKDKIFASIRNGLLAKIQIFVKFINLIKLNLLEKKDLYLKISWMDDSNVTSLRTPSDDVIKFIPKMREANEFFAAYTSLYVVIKNHKPVKLTEFDNYLKRLGLNWVINDDKSITLISN